MLFGIVVVGDAVVSWYRGKAVSGFATIIVVLSVIGSFIMLSLGVIGEYLSRMFDELKRRPPFLIESIGGFTEPRTRTKSTADRTNRTNHDSIR